MSRKTFYQLAGKIQRLKLEQIQAMKETWPVGTAISYMHGDQIRRAQVIGHNDYSPSIRVQGATNSIYWLDACRIL